MRHRYQKVQPTGTLLHFQQHIQTTHTKVFLPFCFVHKPRFCFRTILKTVTAIVTSVLDLMGPCLFITINIPYILYFVRVLVPLSTFVRKMLAKCVALSIIICFRCLRLHVHHHLESRIQVSECDPKWASTQQQ